MAEGYYQTWHKVCRIRPRFLQKPIQWFCGLIIGHERSKTESGYAGGRYIDAWCRWCNHRWQIPVEEEPQVASLLKELWNDGQEPDQEAEADD